MTLSERGSIRDLVYPSSFPRHRCMGRLLVIETVSDYVASLDLLKSASYLVRPDGTVEFYRASI